MVSEQRGAPQWLCFTYLADKMHDPRGCVGLGKKARASWKVARRNSDVSGRGNDFIGATRGSEVMGRFC